MTGLAFLVCLFGSAVCQHWGLPHQVSDTPEVAAARSAHLAALSKAHEKSWSGPEDDGSYRPEHHQGSDDGSDNSWTSGSGSSGGLDHQGSWTGKDDGSYRREHHDGPWDNDHQSHQRWDAPQKKWTGPIAHSPGFAKNGAPLQVLDTPEVAAEKSKHFHLYAQGAYAGAAAHHP